MQSHSGSLENPWSFLAGADIAYFAKGWQDARGCKIENTCAIEYGIPVIEDYTAE